jgi:hypothetical protein
VSRDKLWSEIKGTARETPIGDYLTTVDRTNFYPLGLVLVWFPGLILSVWLTLIFIVVAVVWLGLVAPILWIGDQKWYKDFDAWLQGRVCSMSTKLKLLKRC